jgi:hypothetical protein
VNEHRQSEMWQTPRETPPQMAPIIVRCAEMEELAIVYACGEGDLATRAGIELHTAQCPNCAALLAREVRLQKVISARDDPADSVDRSGLLLAQCRSQLAESLDDQQARSNPTEWKAVISPVQWWMVLRNTLVYHPALSMLVLVVTSFIAGVVGQQMRAPAVVIVPAPPAVTTVANAADTPRLTEQQLQNAGSASVRWVAPSSTRIPNVQVQLMSQMPMSIEGPTDDADVRHALTYVLSHDQKFDPSARMDALEVLSNCTADAGVRHAMCTAARADHHPAVRIKALESLQGLEQDPEVRQTLLDVLQNDVNPGVRVEAINQLLNSLHLDDPSGPVDRKIIGALRDCVHNDPNDYIRFQSAAALQQIGASNLP